MTDVPRASSTPSRRSPIPTMMVPERIVVKRCAKCDRMTEYHYADGHVACIVHQPDQSRESYPTQRNPAPAKRVPEVTANG